VWDYIQICEQKRDAEIKMYIRVRGITEVVLRLLSKYKDLGSISSTTKTNKQKHVRNL
jgi:hypothetical protein